jgi:hypothetical protein
MAKKANLAQAKAARQKKIAIGGAVILVLVLVIQVPRMMKQLKGSSATAATAPAVAPTPAVPTPAAGVPTVAAAPATDKLVSFESFGSKDPFIQQVSAGGSSAPAPKRESTGSGTAPTSGSAASGGAAKTQPTAFKTDAGGGTQASTRKVATISVNDVAEAVSASKTFPKSDPVFKLVSIAQSSVEIAIADGSFKDGDKTITLTKGKALTLLNTADGKRYKLLLVSTSS